MMSTSENDQYRASAVPLTWYVYHRESGEPLDEVTARTAYYAWLLSTASNRYAFSECVVCTVKL